MNKNQFFCECEHSFEEHCPECLMCKECDCPYYYEPDEEKEVTNGLENDPLTKV